MYWLRIVLFSILDSESEGSNNYIIAKYLLDHYNELPGVSLTEISRHCNLSKAAVSRFCKELGLMDYIDLQMLIRSSGQNKNNKTRIRPASDDGFFEKCSEIVRNVENAISSQPYAEELIQDIGRYDQICTFGHLQASHIAYTLRNNLAMYNIFCFCTQLWTEQEEKIRNASADDLIIIFSSSGDYFKRMDINMHFLDREDAPRVYMVSFGEVNDTVHPKIRKISLGPVNQNLYSNMAMNIFINYVSSRFIRG